MQGQLKIGSFLRFVREDEDERDLLSAIRDLMSVEDSSSFTESIKTAPQPFGSWSGWSY